MEKEKFIHADETCFSLLLSMSVPDVHALFNRFITSLTVSTFPDGTDALTAVSLAYPLQNAILSAAVGIGVGISSISPFI